MRADAFTEVMRMTEEVILRELNEPSKAHWMMKLVLMCRYQINWRTSVHSNDSLIGIWTSLGAQLSRHDLETDSVSGITYDVLLRLVDEWIYGLNTIEGVTEPGGLVNPIVDSLLWVGKSKSLPESVQTLIPTPAEASMLLRNNPWVIFLILIGRSNLVNLIKE